MIQRLNGSQDSGRYWSKRSFRYLPQFSRYCSLHFGCFFQILHIIFQILHIIARAEISLTCSISQSFHFFKIIFLVKNVGKIVPVADMPVWNQSDSHILTCELRSVGISTQLPHSLLCKLRRDVSRGKQTVPVL